MPTSRHRSGQTRAQRIERAFTLFAKGYRNVDVCRLLKIAPDTATKYRRQYEEHLQKEVSTNPKLLTDVLGNTIRVIEEIDLVKQDAWQRLDKKPSRDHSCEQCGCNWPLPNSEAVALQKVILDTTQQRMRLFGLLGVKQEYFLHVQRIQLIQAKIVEFLQTQLCEEDRQKFDLFMQAELPMASDVSIIDAEVIEDQPSSLAS